VCELPQTAVFQYDEWRPDAGDVVEFRLVIRDRLPAASQNDKRTRDKQRIRKLLHPQLKNVWMTHPALSRWHANAHVREHHLADNFARCGYRFIPLVNQYFNLCCSLDILFLRRDEPGNLVRHGGDLDNRIKVLFDGLKMPGGCEELGGDVPSDDENPFYCLLEDDKLITEVKVTTDRLLLAKSENESDHSVELIIHVKTVAIDPFGAKVP
jgi:hypothetical protein